MATLQTTATYYRVGMKNVYTGGVGYDGAPCVARYAFTTDAHGAASLSFRTQRMTPDTNDYHNKPETINNFRWLVTAQASGYQGYSGGAGYACEGVYGSHLGGSHSVSLLPNTTYYLWVFPQNTTYCLWWVGGATVTTQGEYGTPSTVEAEDGLFGQSLPIVLSRSVSTVTHTVTVDCAGLHTVLVEKSAQYPTVTWETTLADYAPRLPDAAQAQARITVESFSNGASLGVNTKTVTMSIPQGALEPDCAEGWVSLRPVNEGAAAGFTGCIAGYSRMEAVIDQSKIDPAPLLGATVTGFALEALGETDSQTPYQTPVLRDPCGLTVWILDSRGQRHGRSFSVTPLDYAPPSLSRIRIFRCDSQGATDENGTAIGFEAALDYSDLNGENRCRLTAALRPLDGSYGGETDMTAGAVTVIPGQDPDRSCECRITATDGLGRSATALRRLPTRSWAMKFRPDGRGVAFGKAPERDRALELPADWSIRVGEESLWAALHPVGSVVLADTAPAQGTWTELGAVCGTKAWRRTA